MTSWPPLPSTRSLLLTESTCDLNLQAHIHINLLGYFPTPHMLKSFSLQSNNCLFLSAYHNPLLNPRCLMLYTLQLWFCHHSKMFLSCSLPPSFSYLYTIFVRHSRAIHLLALPCNVIVPEPSSVSRIINFSSFSSTLQGFALLLLKLGSSLGVQRL